MADAEIIAVGSELLTPQRLDTNSLYLTDQLNAREGRVVHPDAPEVLQFQAHQFAQDGANDVAVRDEQNPAPRVRRDRTAHGPVVRTAGKLPVGGEL